MDRHTGMTHSAHMHNISVHEMVHSFTHMITFKGAVIFFIHSSEIKKKK